MSTRRPGTRAATITAWQEWERPLGTLGAGSDALGGWTLDVHHSYDPQGQDALPRRRHARDRPRRSARRSTPSPASTPTTSAAAARPATQIDLGLVRGIDVGRRRQLLHRRDRAATGSARSRPTATSRSSPAAVRPRRRRSATAARRPRRASSAPSDVAVARTARSTSPTPATRASAASTPDGMITHLRGRRRPRRRSATAARRPRPRCAARAASRSPPTARSTSPTPGRDRVRRITPDGRIATAAGGGTPGDRLGDGGPRRRRRARPPDRRRGRRRTGALYIADALHHRVREVAPTGTIETLAGNGGAGSSGDGGPATDAADRRAARRRRRRDGTVYVADRIHHAVRRVNAGRHDLALRRHGRERRRGRRRRAAAGAALVPAGRSPSRPTASLLIADAGNGRVRRAAVGLPGFTDADFSLPSEDGAEVYQFDRDGRHLRTVDALTGSAPLQLRLRRGRPPDARSPTATATSPRSSATRDGNADRRSSRPAAARAHHGADRRRDGYLDLDRRTRRATQTAMTYDAGRAAADVHRPARQAAPRFTYDAASGLLTSDTDAGGERRRATRAPTRPTASRVTTHLAEGRDTVFETATDSPGDTTTTATRALGRGQPRRLRRRRRRPRLTAPDGTVTTAPLGPDPRWGMRAPIAASLTTRTPCGRTRRRSPASAPSTLATQGDLFDVDELIDSTTRDGGTGHDDLRRRDAGRPRPRPRRAHVHHDDRRQGPARRARRARHGAARRYTYNAAGPRQQGQRRARTRPRSPTTRAIRTAP